MNHSIDSLDPQLLRWLPRLHPFQQGGTEALIKAISGLAQVGPKPELAPGVTAATWPQLRSQLIAAGLISEESHDFSEVPYLRFSPQLSRWLAEHVDTETRLTTRRQHQRHYFQFCGQLGKQQLHAAANAEAMAKLEMPNLLSAARGVIEQGEEWGLEFAERLLPFLLLTGNSVEHQNLETLAKQLARTKGSEPWRLHLSNRAEQLYQAGKVEQAELALQELIEGLDDEAGFETCSAWARMGSCRGRLGKLDAAEQAYRQADACSEALPQDDAVLEMRRSIALDLSQLCQQQEAGEWLEAAIHAHSQLQQTRTAIDEFQPFLQGVEAALHDPDARKRLAAELNEARDAGWGAAADAIDRLVDGERNLAELARYLDLDDAALIQRLLANIKKIS